MSKDKKYRVEDKPIEYGDSGLISEYLNDMSEFGWKLHTSYIVKLDNKDMITGEKKPREYCRFIFESKD